MAPGRREAIGVVGGGPQHRVRRGRPPVQRRVAAPGRAPGGRAASGVGVADHHEIVRRGLLAFLDGEPDMDVVGEAAGGAEALDLLAALESQGRRPDVIVMDLQMTPVDGIESIRRIRGLYDDVEVVALTSFADAERVHAALQAGACGYVLKTSDADDVAAAVRAARRGVLQIDPIVARMLRAPRRGTRDGAAISELTSRELEVLRHVAAGKPNKQIAAELAISERTSPGFSPSSA